jgi:hypothetical protein
VKFRQERITLQEADRRYAELKQQYDAGTITDEEFDEQLKQLMALDDQGRWWAKSRTTGEWHYYNGTAWVKDTPPEQRPTTSQESGGSSIHKPSMDELLQICVRYDGRRYFAGDAIPSDVLAKARDRFRVPHDKRVAALVEIGQRGGGVVICEDGLRFLRWHPDLPWSARRNFLGWRDFGDVFIDLDPPRWGSMYKLKVGKGNILAGRDKDMNHLGLAQLLREIQALVSTSPTG